MQTENSHVGYAVTAIPQELFLESLLEEEFIVLLLLKVISVKLPMAAGYVVRTITYFTPL